MHDSNFPNERNLIKRSLRYSIIDGSFAASMIGFGESFIPAYAVFLMATNIELGLLTSIPLLVGSLIQFFSHYLLHLVKSRKKLVSMMALLQGVMYIPILLIFFLKEQKVTYLIILACTYWIFGMVLSPAWNSWMGDLVSEKERGSYFGKRNRITGSVSFASYLAAGYILYLYPAGTSFEYLGFVTIFLFAMSSRIFSYIYLNKKYEPPYEAPPKPDFTFTDFIREARFRNYGRFVLYLCVMNFSVYMAAPFFVPYMLKDLHLDYLSFSVINASAILIKFLAMPVWGNASDQFGTKKILTLTGFLMPCIPLLWVISHDLYYLIAIQVFSGFIWAGFELASFNFVFDTTTSKNRVTVIAYYNVLNGIFIFTGSIMGSLVVKYNDLFWSSYFLVFILSTVFRYTASFTLIPKLKEVRIVEAIPYSKLFFKIIRTMPTAGVVFSSIPFRKKH